MVFPLKYVIIFKLFPVIRSLCQHMLNCIQYILKFWLKMIMLLHFLLIFLFICPLDTSLTILIESFAACETNKKFPLQVSNLSAYNRRGKSYASAHLMVTESIKGPIEQEVILERCDMQKTKCLSAPQIYSPDQCTRLNESYFASNFFGKMKPPIYRCPFQPVIYFLKFFVSRSDFCWLYS